jgi:CRISPR-associated protein Cas1
VIRDHAQRVDTGKVMKTVRTLTNATQSLLSVESHGQLMGIEGEAASQYFAVFDELILHNKEAFYFHKRSRRPPMDNVNVLLSFIYTLLANDTAAAASAVGLDPFVGFLHKDRPGRRSLALDLMEELRAPLADRFVLTMINTRQIEPEGFEKRENGAVYLKDNARKAVLNAWQTRKHEQIVHPFLKEKIEWGIVPHAQALLLARFLRGDLEAYPPFLWK